jgi:serine/threonine-protein kinase RsbW
VADRVELEVPASNEYLAVVRDVLTAVAAAGSKLPDGRIDDLRLAVTEACANAIDAEHRKPEDQRSPIHLHLELEPDCVVVEVHDEAGGFDPDAVPAQPEVTKPERLRYERGLGIPLMRALTDDVDFRAEGGGTTVRLVVDAVPRT